MTFFIYYLSRCRTALIAGLPKNSLSVNFYDMHLRSEEELFLVRNTIDEIFRVSYLPISMLTGLEAVLCHIFAPSRGAFMMF